MKEIEDFFPWVVVIVFLLIVGLVYWGLQDSKSTSVATSDDGASIVYYYGDTCPHCKDVAKFLDENKISEKVNFVKKEVWNNRKNAAEMDSRAASCDLKKEGMGVPFLFAEGKCYVGTPDVISFFKKAAGLE